MRDRSEWYPLRKFPNVNQVIGAGAGLVVINESRVTFPVAVRGRVKLSFWLLLQSTAGGSTQSQVGVSATGATFFFVNESQHDRIDLAGDQVSRRVECVIENIAAGAFVQLSASSLAGGITIPALSCSSVVQVYGVTVSEGPRAAVA